MKSREFKKLLKEDKPQHIIFLHTIEKIFLTDKQIEKVLEKRNKDGRKKC